MYFIELNYLCLVLHINFGFIQRHLAVNTAKHYFCLPLSVYHIAFMDAIKLC